MEMMCAESRETPERARKNHAMVLTGLSRIGQVNVAKALGVSEGQISKMKDNQLEQFAKLLAACELKVVGTGRKCVLEDEYLWMTRIVSRALANERTARELLFEEPE